MQKEINEDKDYVVIGEKIIPPQGRRKYSIIMQAVLPKNMDWDYFNKYMEDVHKMINELNNNKN